MTWGGKWGGVPSQLYNPQSKPIRHSKPLALTRFDVGEVFMLDTNQGVCHVGCDVRIQPIELSAEQTKMLSVRALRVLNHDEVVTDRYPIVIFPESRPSRVTDLQ